MKHMLHVKIPTWYTSILYLIGFLLFLEWLYPVKQITDTTQMHLFFIYAAVCFGITLFRLPFIIRVILKGFGAVFMMHQLFFDEPFLSFAWLIQLIEEIFYHVTLIFNQEWSYFTPLFRSFLFLLLIWLMSYFIYYWFVHLKHLFLFIILTFVYVGVLDAFTPYDAGLAMMRIFIFSLLALGMSHLMKELKKEHIDFAHANSNKWKWVFSLSIIIAFSTVIGLAIPKWEAQWDDPVPFLKEVAGLHGKGKTIKKVGFGEDDTQLGGSFVEDYSPVFQAIAKEKQYWRVETKDIYTGKGWKKTPSLEDDLLDGKIGFSTFEDTYVETEFQKVEIEFEKGVEIPKLVYPYGVTEVITDEAGVQFYEDNSDAIRVEMKNGKNGINTYQLVYNHPSYPYDFLQDNRRLLELAEDERMDSNFMSQYTQLPEDIPSRIQDLAMEVTGEYEGYYNKIKAVEQYFHQNGFIYQTSNIPIPDEEDYVDQFLFDTKKGYCDNYSTSMIVMLRTLGIPSRWVKGFTGGEKIDTVTKGEEVYSVFQVTNMNAHSWVEVYFPEVGWIPFEPTQGFSNLADFHTEEELEGTNNTVVETPEQTEQVEQPKETEETNIEQKEDASEEKKKTSSNSMDKYLITIPILLVALIGIVLYRKRLIIQTKFMEMRWEKSQDVQTFQNLYHHLLKLLEHKGIKKDNQQTLREYAKQVDLWYDTDAMERLTTLYEQVLYRNEQVIQHPDKITQLSKKLINHIMG